MKDAALQSWESRIILFFSTVSAAAGAAAGAFTAGGAADAFYALLFGLIDVQHRKANDGKNYQNNNRVFHRLTSFRRLPPSGFSPCS